MGEFILCVISIIFASIIGIFAILGTICGMMDNDGDFPWIFIGFLFFITAGAMIPASIGLNGTLQVSETKYKLNYKLDSESNICLLEYSVEIKEKKEYNIFRYDEVSINGQPSKIDYNQKLYIEKDSKIEWIQKESYSDVFVIEYKDKYYSDFRYEVLYPLNWTIKQQQI